MSDQVMSCQFSSDQCRVKAEHVLSAQDKVTSCQVRPCLSRRCHDIVRVGHVMSGQIRSDKVMSCRSRSSSCQVRTHQVRSEQVRDRSGNVRSGQIVSG